VSRIPGPTGKGHFSEASRTPGSLGINDAGSPDRPPWLLGDTPGSLGINDHASATVSGHPAQLRAPVPRQSATNRWEKFVDSVCDWKTVSGPRIAWQSSGHYSLTSDAARAAVLKEMLPVSDARRRLLKVLAQLPEHVVATDITFEQYSDSKLKGIVSEYGQATHFMAYAGQSQRDAYTAGIHKVFEPAERAARLFKEIRDDSDLTTRSTSKLDDVGVVLGDAVHALQDSFSPAHVQRDKVGNRSVIMRLFVWREQEKKEHEAGDESWKSSSGTLTELGRACSEATTLLLGFFILSAVNKDVDAERQRTILMDKYLSRADPSRSGWR
jgi:hypothetical protein